MALVFCVLATNPQETETNRIGIRKKISYNKDIKKQRKEDATR